MARKNVELGSGANVGCLIGANSVIEGNFCSSESVRIDGMIKGNVEVKGNLFVGAKGKVIGNIKTENIMVSGEVEGDIFANAKVEIASSGVVNGDIQAKVLLIEENAVFNGRCGMTEDFSESNIVHANVETIKENAS